MGAYCTYYYNGIYLDSTKNDIDISILKLIELTDIFKLSYQNTPEYIVDHYDISEIDEEDNFYTIIRVDKNILLDRLKIKGYSLSFSQEMFDLSLAKEIERNSQSQYDFVDKELQVLKQLNFETWLENLKFIQSNKLNRFKYNNDFENTNLILHYMLKDDWYGFKGLDVCIFLRLLLEISEDGEFVCDITDLLLSGYVDEDYIKNVQDRYFNIDKIILLTEGKTDIEILSRALRLFYPHLYSYFAFMDFENSKVEGGVGFITGIVKSFAGVGISNKIVALYDNDTAAKVATKQLEKIKLPNNLKIMYLPDIEKLRNYPTIGPTGLISMNVNGMAGSIEMYLGNDALFDNQTNSYYPIQWKGYESGLSQYQGEIIEKKLVQKKFYEILEKCEKDNTKIKDYDFEDLHLVLIKLFEVFEKYEQNLILEEIEEYYNL
ncbi:hypothetical protein ACRCD7_10460 [Aliarcobacter sp. ERUVET-7]|uniref:hypothetical protein n=1 Tax=Aliarcobacter sp. ERUVET-7 TaxID=3429683 RepID=UPI003D6BC748